MIEVRCCCQPKKLLGWMDVREPRHGSSVTFLLTRSLLDPQHGSVQRLTLPLAPIVEDGRSWLAFKAEDTPIETLRRIGAFREAA